MSITKPQRRPLAVPAIERSLWLLSFSYHLYDALTEGNESAEKRDSSVISRTYEVGPQPKTWPQFLEFKATPNADHNSVLWSTLKANRGLLLGAFVMSVLMFVGGALIPWALGIFLDSGLEKGLTASLIPGGLLLSGVILVRALGSFSEPVLVASWMRGDFGWRRDIVGHISTIRGGGREHIPSGEIVAAVTSDTQKSVTFSTVCLLQQPLHYRSSLSR